VAELVFSFGTLQNESVQRSVYGRLVPMQADSLPGYRVGRLRITDPAVIEASGSDVHPALVAAEPGVESEVAGQVLELSAEELAATDVYESVGYHRTEVILRSGRTAWVYSPRDAGAVMDSDDEGRDEL
jgi:gamma-glutamylcyclotransferase (GGCT)/AIG2-like uncharacterized protein YtfP